MTRFDPVAFVLVRTPNGGTDPATLTTRANGFATAAKECDSATLLVHRNESGMNGFLILEGPDDSAATAAINIAQAVGARAERVELPDSLLGASAVARATYRSGSSVAREAMVGVDPTEISRRLEVALRTDDWVGLTIREPSPREDKRNERWTDFRLGGAGGVGHQSRQPDAQVVSIYAGSSDHKSADRLIEMTRSALHGFDLKVRSERVSLLAGIRTAALAAVATLGAALVLLAGIVPALADQPVAKQAGTLLFGLSLLFTGVTVAKATGLLPTLWHRVRRGLPDGVLPSPAHRRFRPRPPREADRDARTGKKTRSFEGDYPLHSSAFLMAPVVFVGIIAPYSEAAASSAVSRKRMVPPHMQQRIGPLVGFDQETPAYLSLADAYSGIALMGRAGSGKSQLLRSIFGWYCLDRISPSGLPGSTGVRSTLVAFENKGAGVMEYQAWAAATRTPLVFIDLADPGSYAIDLFASTGTISQRAEAFVNALQYGFDDDAIRDRAFTSLQALYAAALAISEDRSIVAEVDGIDPNGSVNYYAHVLVGNLGEPLQNLLASQALGLAKVVRPDGTPPSEQVRAAADALAPYFEGLTSAQRRNLFESSQNKIKQLQSLDSWWSPNRKKVSWRQVLGEDAQGRHRAVLINTGSSMGGIGVEDKLGGIMSSLLMYSLQRAIRNECITWEKDGRSVSIFADELALLSGSGPEVITWLKDQGRSYGVRPVFATQRPAQLDRAVKEVFLNFGTLVCFNQEDRTTAVEVAAQLSGVEGEVTGDEVMHLSQYHAVVRGYATGLRQSPFTVAVHNFEADRSAAAVAHGFEGSGTPTAPATTPAPSPGPVLPYTQAEPSLVPPTSAPPTPGFSAVPDGPVMPDPRPAQTVTPVAITEPDDESPSGEDLLSW